MPLLSKIKQPLREIAVRGSLFCKASRPLNFFLISLFLLIISEKSEKSKIIELHRLL